MAGRTTLMITHDLNLAPDADHILVLDRGRIVETGRHDELLARGGTYARLYSSGRQAETGAAETYAEVAYTAEMYGGYAS